MPEAAGGTSEARLGEAWQERLEGLLGIGLFFQLSRILLSMWDCISKFRRTPASKNVGASLEAFLTPQRGQPMPRGALWMSMFPVPNDGTGQPGGTIHSFAGVVVAFGGCGAPGLLPGDSSISNTLLQIPQFVLLQHLILHIH